MHAGQGFAVDQIGSKHNGIAIGLRIITRRQGTLDLPQRYGVDFDTLLAHQAQDMDV